MLIAHLLDRYVKGDFDVLHIQSVRKDIKNTYTTNTYTGEIRISGTRIKYISRVTYKSGRISYRSKIVYL